MRDTNALRFFAEIADRLPGQEVVVLNCNSVMHSLSIICVAFVFTGTFSGIVYSYTVSVFCGNTPVVACQFAAPLVNAT